MADVVIGHYGFASQRLLRSPNPVACCLLPVARCLLPVPSSRMLWLLNRRCRTMDQCRSSGLAGIVTRSSALSGGRGWVGWVGSVGLPGSVGLSGWPGSVGRPG